MIEIPFWPFVVLVQLAIVCSLAAAILFYLWRRTRYRLLKCITASERDIPADSPPDIRQYLSQEEKMVQGRYDALGYEETAAANARDEEERLILSFRRDMLNLEHEFAQIEERDENYWGRVIKGLTQLLKRHDLYSRFAFAAEGEGLELRSVMEEQSKVYEELSSGIESQESDVLKQKLEVLAKSHKELSSCVFTLEDENYFLREQISALLKTD